MHYEINVSQNGKHVFATHERSLQTREQTIGVYTRLMVAFPESDGYKISVSIWETVGQTLDLDDLLKITEKKRK